MTARTPPSVSLEDLAALPDSTRRGLPERLTPAEIDPLIQAALAEDLREGDFTSRTSVPERAQAQAVLTAKQAGVLAGIDVFARTFELCDAEVRVELLSSDGQAVEAGTEVARIVGSARSLLAAERTALNLMQRMSGIATRTADLVRRAQAAAPDVRLLDTRKTTPLMRRLEKYAVRCGGGENHRFGLFDEVLLKENHIELAGRPIEEVLRAQRAELGPAMRITAEARDEAEAQAAVDGGADVVLLDNMTPQQMAELCPKLRERAQSHGRSVELEASGGIDESSIAKVAATGVDRISVGGLTHSVQSLDLSLYLQPLGDSAGGGNGSEGGERP